MEQTNRVLKKRRDTVDALFSGEGPLDEILAGEGVSPGAFFGWLEDPAFAAYLRGQTKARSDAAVLFAWKALLRGVERGETGAIKLFFELKAKEGPEEKALTIRMDGPAGKAAL